MLDDLIASLLYYILSLKCTCTLPSSFTLIRSSYSLDLHIQVQLFIPLPKWWRVMMSQSVPLLDSGIFLYFVSVVSLILYTHQFQLLFLCFIHLLSCVDIYMYCWVILIHHGDCIGCSGYFSLSVYTWDILLAYICRWLSSRLRFRVFFWSGAWQHMNKYTKILADLANMD